MENKEETWFFIINPRAGSGKTLSRWRPAERQLRQEGIPFTTAHTTHKQHAISLAYDAAAQGYRHICAAGGDGTLHEVFNGIVRYCDDSGTPTEAFFIAVFPIGSGNDWLKSLGVPHDAQAVLRLLRAHAFRRMDVVRATSGAGQVTYMANVGGTGFDAQVCQRVNVQKERGRSGKLIYLRALLHAIFHARPIRLRLTADGKTVFDGPCYSVALGNGPYSGNGMRQVPDARIDDGLLDYMVVPQTAVLRLLPELPRLFNGSIRQSALIRSGRCTRLQITAAETAGSLVEIDGENAGTLPLEIHLDGRQINALTEKTGTGV